MLRSHWKKGHTVYLPKDYKLKPSIPHLLQGPSAKSSESQSCFLPAPLKCLPSLKSFSINSWPSTRICLYGSRGHMEPPHSPRTAALLNYSSAHCLFFAKQPVEKSTWSAWPDTFYTGHLPPAPPFIIHPARPWEGRREWHGNAKPAVHLPFPRGFTEMPARLGTWEHTHMQRRMKKREPYLLNLVDLGEKGKGKKQGNKS